MGRGIAAAAIALCAGTALAQDPVRSEQNRARAVAEEAAAANETADIRALIGEAQAGAAESLESGDLEDWTRSAVADALGRAGSAASETADALAAAGNGEAAIPLAAERHAAGIAAGPPDRPNTAEVLVFMSLAVPESSWAQWGGQAARAGASLVLRGVLPAGLRTTAIDVGRRLGGHEAGVAVDPRLFRLFGVERVPAVVAVPGGVPACASHGCADDAPPRFDAITGNIGLAAALEAIAAEGDVARETALAHLKRLGGRP